MATAMTRFSEHAQASMRTLVCWAFCCSLWKGPARAWGRLRVSKWHPRIYIYIYIYACIYIYAWSSTYSDFVCGLRSTLGGLMVGISTGDSVCMIAVMSVSTCIWIAYVYLRVSGLHMCIHSQKRYVRLYARVAETSTKLDIQFGH